ncbi:MAG: hypothetical protein ACLPVY_01880 [Acidimicrobiia bacterium]
MTPEAQGWLVAVFERESVARHAAHKTRQTGVDPKAIRVGDPIDALTSIRGEMRDETNELVGFPLGPQPSSAVGTVIALRLAASAGTTLAVPDTEPARRVLLQARSVRVDVVGSDGRPVDTLRTHSARTALRQVSCVRRERKFG